MQNPQTMTSTEINLRLDELGEFILDEAGKAEFATLYDERQKRNIADAQEYWANWRDLAEMDTSGSYSYEVEE